MRAPSSVLRTAAALRRRTPLSAQEGSLLIEVMVGAIVLAIATLAILSGLDGAQGTGLQNKQRSAAATLAQQDIERLRAFPITALSNYTETREVKLSGAFYTVSSRTEWVRDSAAEVTCTDNTPQANYIKISSTANPKNLPNRTVKEVSLLTPAPGAFSDTMGTAAVKVSGRTGDAQSGVQVSLSGAGSFSTTTNSLGCAVFDFVPAGSYTIQVSGLVNWAGESTASMTVAAGKTTLRQLEMEAPASLRANFELPPAPTSGPAWPTPLVAQWASMTVSNAKLPGGTKSFTAGSPVTSIDGTGLFPFLDGYGVYAGTCSRNNPAFHQSDYFQVSGGKGSALLDPAELLENVQVQMGTLRLTVRNSSNALVSGALVTVRQGDSAAGCNLNLLMGTGTTDANGVATFVVPFGTYRLCASGPSNNNTRFRLSTTNGGSGAPAHPIARPRSSQAWSTSMNPTSSFTLPSSGSTGNCPTDLDL
jgi:Tfp pilus assembly protein PilV